MDADAPVAPRDGQHDGLAKPELGPEVPERQRHAGIRIHLTVEQVGHLRAHHVPGEQHGNREPERELGRLPRGHPPRAAPVDRPERHRDVDDEGAVERDGADRVPPEGHEPPAPCLHGVERDETERVIRQVERDVGEEHATRPEAESAAPSLDARSSLRHGSLTAGSGFSGTIGQSLTCPRVHRVAVDAYEAGAPRLFSLTRAGEGL